MRYPDEFINKIVCGDCLEVMKDIPDESIDLVIADPPYNKVTNESWDNIEDYQGFSRRWLGECRRVLKNTGNIYVWCSLGEKSTSLLTISLVLKEHFIFKDMIVWQKQRGRGNRRGWLFTREEILWAVKTKNFLWNKKHQYGTEKRAFTFSYKDKEREAKYLKSIKSPFKRLTNVWTDIREPNLAWNKREVITTHYTPKPIKAIERIILSHTKKQDIVLDPFIGSGTTSVACKALDRNYIGIEISEEYCKESRRRTDGS